MKIAIIGSGFSGLSAACYAAKAGHEVHVYEKNSIPGGRARQFKTDNGYTFDMGPSWYWMPDIIADFFHDFGYQPEDFYKLVALDPQFEMIFSDGNFEVPKNYDELRVIFEDIEAGSGQKLDEFMEAARYKYEVGMKEFVYKPCHSWWEFFSPKIAKSAFKLDLLSDFRSYVKKYFTHPKLIALMEFPVIFLGASPKNIPALYSLMNYGGYALGTWYPMGGFYEVIKAMHTVAENQGVKFYFNHHVERIDTQHDQVSTLLINGVSMAFDAVIASSDYHHTETLLDEKYRNYTDKYWEDRIFAPSSLIYYLGFSEPIPNLKHHTLFFEHDLDIHIDAIYKEKKWPDNPLFYSCCPSKTDPDVAPVGHENIFLLMPLAIGIEDDEAVRERYLDQMLARLAKHVGVEDLKSKIDYKRSYCVSDFIADYHAYKGNAYGLANTLGQTAVWKPAIKNKKLANLYYTGQLTVPGPGVPPAIISGKIVANEVHKLNLKHHEETV
ncbi:phytoene desaturase family protein [Sphingobacterium faecium]|jgi:phytoene desaturase|uniref:phytoene desaturase family protein n=1 Tax=Sphingobacterium faecium TaxID=34087 RepID=UPI0021B5641B|nr:phytoene desaturase family protein [Sphingobacterium faecium]UXD69476.1 phytoene desaturase family protein [Sphingobacterium faecium]WGQ13021.1 phytoene desaturase family protein [Sphingobacterium faecium]